MNIASVFDIRSRFLLCGIFLLVGCDSAPEKTLQLPYYRDSGLTPEWISADSIPTSAIHQIDHFSLTDQNGATISEQQMEGNICIVDFFFTVCPSLCPKLTRSMLRLQDSLKDQTNVLLFSYSVTPETDSVPVLKAYATANGIVDKNWHLLTGSKEEIYNLARQSYFANVDTGTAAFLHTETFYLLDKERHIRGIYNGTLGTDILQIIADVRLLANES